MTKWHEKSRSKGKASGPFVALDLDSRSLRVVHAEPRASGLPVFRKLAVVPVPEGTDMSDPDSVGRFLGKALRDLRLTGLPVAMDVPRGKALLKSLTLPPVADERELPGMVRYQVEKELPYAMSEAVIDFTVEKHMGVPQGAPPVEGDGAAGAGEQVLVASVRRAVVEYYQKVAAAAPIDLQQLGLRPYADVHCLRACLGDGASQDDAVLIHLNADEAEINVLLDGALAFSRSATMAVAHDEKGAPVADSPVEALALEVVRTVQSVRATRSATRIAGVWLAGATGHEEALAKHLEPKLGCPCQTLDPVDRLSIKNAPEGGSGFLTALGLAIGHTERGLPLDFLHPKEPPIERNLKKIRATYGAIAAGVALAIIIGAGMWNRHAAASELAERVARYNALDEQLRPVRKMADRVQGVDKWLGADRRWLDHWANITAAFPAATDAYITTLKTTTAGSITLTIKARSFAVITEAARKLGEAGYDVKLAPERSDENEFGYRVSTDLTLTPKAEPQIDGLSAPPRPGDDASADPAMRNRRRNP